MKPNGMVDDSIHYLHGQFETAKIYRAYIVIENGKIRASHPELLAPITEFLKDCPDWDDHEAIFVGREPGINTLFFAFVHNTHRGLAQGGLRLRHYGSVREVFVDGLRLAQGMTRKNALAGLWWGGGKGIIPLPNDVAEATDLEAGHWRRREIFRAYGRFIASLGGIYYTAEDMGTKTEDMDTILGENRFITCTSTARGGSSNPSPFTARGVFRAMQAAWGFLGNPEDLKGVRIAVQGAGNVGYPLIEQLDRAGAIVYAADTRRDAIKKIEKNCSRVRIENTEQILYLDVDILAPCAQGAVIHSDMIPGIKAKLICGAANNILKNPTEDSELLREKGITFIPDYLCNRMGIMNCADEWCGGYFVDADEAEREIEKIYADTLEILQDAKEKGRTPVASADARADKASREFLPPELLRGRGQKLIRRLVNSRWSGGGSS